MKERQLIDVVSGRIRDRRADKRLSLDRLAALSGVSKGMLVQIENGDANPSIDLVQESGRHPAEVLPAGAPRLLWRGPKGGSATLLVGSSGPDMLELWSWVLQPRERYEAQAHPQGTEELIHVVRGRLALAFGDVSYVIESGGSAVAHTDRPHAYACDGKTPVHFTMVVAEWHAPRRDARRPREKG
jgi:DNA-binding XRE family transcriptional regulator/quercetin dioxygenase-like cupin family protein